jgi:EmrB/QacA subfamily drug resistance transporter
VVSSADIPEGEAAAVRRGGRGIALAVLCVVLFLTFLDNTIVSVGLGNIQTQLHAGVSSLQWVVGAYALTFAGTMLAFGMVGDEFGRKRVMLIGIVIFCAGSILSALASGSHAIDVLIGGRAVMGFGAAASEPGTLSMIRHLYPTDRRRTRALGVWTAVSGLALAMGPVLGGALVGAWDWRAIFWFNLIVGSIAFIAGAIVLPENSDPEAHRVDITGFCLGAAAISALAFAVILAESSGFGSPECIALLCVTVAGAIAFLWWERTTAYPLLDVRFLRVPRFLTANVLAFSAYFATFALFFFTALYLNEVVGDSGFQIALTFLPMTAVMVLASVLAGFWTVTAGLRWSMFLGCLLFGAGLLLTSLAINPHPSYLPLAASLALAGIGVGATVVPATSASLSAIPPERSGMAASTTNTAREIGAVTGVAVLGAIVNSRLTADITSSMQRLGIPKGFQTTVINGVETGTAPSSANLGSIAQAYGKLGTEVVNAAYSAFQAGLHIALYLSAGLVFAAGIFSFIALAQRESKVPATSRNVLPEPDRAR